VVRGFALLALIAALGVAVATQAPAATPQPGVLIIGDSVATGMSWNDAAIAAVQKNLAVQWQVEICRTVAGVSCPFDGRRPPTMLDVVRSLGHVPPIVVVVVGYNDPAETFRASVDSALAALTAAGAKHVLWLTLRAARAPYPALNEMLHEATARWPSLELVDWDGVSAPHPEWFQTDDAHLLPAGGLAMAHLIHASIFRIVDPLRVVPPLRFRDGHAYSLRLQARGGTAPYTWRVESGRPPHGFHLRSNGAVVAHPRQPATFRVAVTDADGVTADARVLVR
jgi:hypothetical protein